MLEPPRRPYRSRRFLLRYLRRRAQVRQSGSRFYVRPLRIFLGILLVVLSPLVGWVPGPGGMFLFIPGILLLSSEIRRAAVLLDHIENETVPRLRVLRASIRFRGRVRGPRPEWVAEDPAFWERWAERRGIELPDDAEIERAAGRGFGSWSTRERFRAMRRQQRARRDERREERVERREERAERREERRVARHPERADAPSAPAEDEVR